MTDRSSIIPERGLAASVVAALLVVAFGLIIVGLSCRGETSPSPELASSPRPLGPQPAACVGLR